MIELEDVQELSVQYINLPDFMRVYPDRVKIENNRAFGLDFYHIKHCACIGSLGHCIAPIGAKDGVTLILNESFNTDINQQQKNIVVGSAFLGNFVHLRQAAPLNHLWSNTFWHWCMESLPKLLVLELMGYTGPYIVHRGPNFILESLQLLGISEDRIIYNDSSFFVDELILPQRFHGERLGERLPLLQYLRSAISKRAGTPPSGPERLYLPRSATRRVANEEEFSAILDKHGFTVVQNEDLPFAEQVRLMMHVRLSVMPHGAGGFLSLFQPHDSYRIELFSNSYTPYHTIPIIKLLNLRYIPIVESYTEPFELEDLRRKQVKDIKVPIELFKTILENIVKKLDN